MDHEARLDVLDARLQAFDTELAEDRIYRKANYVLLKEIKGQTTLTNGRVTRLEKTIAAIKWVFIGGAFVGLATHFGFWETIGRLIK